MIATGMPGAARTCTPDRRGVSSIGGVEHPHRDDVAAVPPVDVRDGGASGQCPERGGGLVSEVDGHVADRGRVGPAAKPPR